MVAIPDRRLAAIMVADAAGFSRLMESAESQTYARMRRVREEITNPLVEKHGGRVIKTTGDGFLAEFGSAVAALRCGIDIQQSVMALEAETAIDSRIRLRIGINVGDIIIDAADIAGDGINIAARLEAKAPLDGICVSSMVHDQIREDLGVVFEDLGPLQLKNIARPIRAYAINLSNHLPEGKATSAIASSNEKPNQIAKLHERFISFKGAIAALVVIGVGLGGYAGYRYAYQTTKTNVSASNSAIPPKDAGPLSILVLPFTNATGDPQQAYIADGVTASLTADLSRLRDAYVVAAATAYTYKDKVITLQQVGKELGIRFVLQGSVQRDGEKIRINAQLGDSSSNAQLWSETFDGDRTELFRLQDKVTSRIGNSIAREMVIVAARESETRRNSPVVADLMLRAKALRLRVQTLKDVQEIEALCRQVLVVEKDNASAMSMLARVLILQAGNFGYLLDENTREAKYAEGRALSLKAKTIDPEDPEIYASLGQYANDHDDLPGAKVAAETRLLLQPNYPSSHANLASIYLNYAEPQRAIELLNHAISLDPKRLNPFTLYVMGRAYFMLGNNDVAIEWLEKSAQMNPGLPMTYCYLAMAHALKGDDTKAGAAVANLSKVAPKFKISDASVITSTSPAAYRKWHESKFLPAWRKAKLPE